jgi:hypothetical protein
VSSLFAVIGEQKRMSNELAKTIETFRRRAEMERKRMQQQKEKQERQEAMRQRRLKKDV